MKMSWFPIAAVLVAQATAAEELAYFHMPRTDYNVSPIVLRIEPENRCSPFDSTDYDYAATEQLFREAMQNWIDSGNGAYCPYTRKEFTHS